MQELRTEACERVLARNRYGRLGCYSKLKDEVYVVPISFSYHDGSVYFAAVLGQKLDYLRSHPQGVCLEVDEVDDELNWISVIATARFEELDGVERLLEEAPALKRAERGPLHFLFDADVPPIARDQLVIAALRVSRMTGRKERWTWDQTSPLLAERTRS